MTDNATFGSIKVDASKSEAGEWRKYPNSPIECLIARTGTMKFDKALHRAMRSIRGVKNMKEIEENSIEINMVAASDVILLDWRNAVEEDGSENVFSSKKALALFKNPNFYHFYKWVLEEAGLSEEELSKFSEDLSGN